MIKIKLKKAFNLDSTVTCGQIFRFIKKEDSSYDIVLKDRVINVYKKEEFLYVSSNVEDNLKSIVEDYFDLNNDYDTMNEILMKSDKKLENAINFSKGLMMIRQDPFETIIEYIISANNGVNQIANALNLIAEKYGKRVEFNNNTYYLFPQYKDLKNIKEEDLRLCKVGFRDRYLKLVIDKINNGYLKLDEFYNLNTEDALAKLMENNGIGPKVASCILLFAYQKYDVFPVDTWVKKIMKSSYNIEGEKNIRTFASNTYGKYSAIAIQYLFNYSRNNN